MSQSGYGLMAVVALGRSDLAVTSLLFFLVACAVANLAAFGVMTVLVVSFLSFVGVPPLAGFTAKVALF